MINLKEIIAITGKPGLYRIVARTAKGVIVESLDDKKVKMPVQNNYQVALLEEITIFTAGDDDLPLKTVFANIEGKDGESPSVTHKDEPVKIKAYFNEIAPNHDPERVYISDMKKVLKWYEVLSQFSRQDEPEPQPEAAENAPE